MSQPVACSRLRLNLVDWANAVNNPNVLPEAGANGSYYLRQGDAVTLPTEIYQRLNPSGIGWVKQNVVNIEIYNVRDFGAVGDGVTDDVVAIRAAIDAANAAGGGIVYFPPGSWKIGHRLTANASFDLSNIQNITFLGDGVASKILVIGDAALGDWFVWYLHNGTSNIVFSNLYMDGAGITNPNEQTHMILHATASTDTHGGAHHVVVEQCSFGFINGDNLRYLGEAISGTQVFVHDCLAVDNTVNSPGCRACFGVQRDTTDITAIDNFFSGSNDQEIDFEPTGSVANVQPQQYCLVGNQVDHLSKDVVGVTLDGIGSTLPSFQSVFAYNLLLNMSLWEMRDTQRWQVHGNIALYTAAAGNDIGLSLPDGVHENVISANIFDRPNRVAQQYTCLSVEGGSSTRERVSFLDNVGAAYGINTGGRAFNFEDTNDGIMDGNIATIDDATANVANGFRVNASTQAIDGIQLIGNMALCVNAVALQLFSVSVTAAFTVGNGNMYGNFGRNTGTLLRYLAQGGGSFVDFQGACDNLGVAVVTNILLENGFTAGVTVEGDVGPAARFVQAPNVPGGNVPSPVGSVSLNTAGVDGTVFNYKVAAASIIDTAGWDGHGGEEITFAAQSSDTVTTARFLATGMALLVASATELKWATPRPCFAKAIRVKCIAGTGGGSNTYTLRRNGASVGLTCTFANTGTSGSGTANVVIAAGDLLGILITKTLAAATAQTFVAATVELSA